MTHHRRVLIADDSDSDRALLRAMLEREGYSVTAVADGAEAVVAFDREQPDIVLLDAMMPGMDGFDAARTIKSRAGTRFVPLIFLTALSAAGDLAHCLEVGGDDFVCKPYNTVILRAKLAAFERMGAMHREVSRSRAHVEQVNAHLVREQAVAKAVYDNVIRPRSLAINNLRHHLSPLAVFNGDVLLATRHAGGGMFVFLGDFTGHGLPAAIGAMPTAEIFYGMAAKGFSLSDIVREINAKLRRILPIGIFCCGSMLEIDFRKGLIHVWHGGLPDAYVYRAADRSVTHIVSRHLPLGVLTPARFDASVQTFEVAPGDRIFMCSDGILEACDAEGTMFGAARLDAVLSAGHAPADLFPAVKESVLRFLGGIAPQDDFTMLEATVVDEATLDAPVPLAGVEDDAGADEWKLAYELGGRSLRTFNPLPLLQQVLVVAPGLRQRAGELYTVLSELYSNALDHGVLGLDSALKDSPQGFGRYYALRAERLAELTDARIRFEIEHQPDDDGGELHIRVIDSGTGFPHDDWQQQRAALANERKFCGRGIPLLARLCESLHYQGSGNDVTALYRWRPGG